jgi:hypothetical protein
MSSPTLRRVFCCLFVFAFNISVLAQSTGGRIIGKVSDSTGAVVNGVNVKLTNVATGVSREAQTNENGDYTFVEVIPGSYRVEYTQQGFKRNVRESVTLEVNQVLTLNATLQPGGTQETVEVTSEAPQVDTTSTQLGAVINDRSVNELPLNARDTYQFLQLQPGVQSQLGTGNGSLFYGAENAGSVSVNGGRTRANNFTVNGGDANDQFVNLPTIEPTPDSIEEFRVLTNTFDAEFGRNSGAVVNVVTKSGTNAYHGNIYEYFRNTVLNANNYCFALPCVKPQFNQNQFGGTFGGPIKKDKTFYFVSYEGRRVRQGQVAPAISVPTTPEAGGDFSAVGPFTGGIDDPSGNPFVANVLDGRKGCDGALGIASVAGLPVQPNSPTTGNPFIPWSEVFPNGVIPSACQDPVAANLVQRFVPGANAPGGLNQSVVTGSDTEDQFTVKFDHHINDHQTFTAYYYFTDIAKFEPYNNFQAAGANVPGFGDNTGSRYQQWNLNHTWTLRNNLVNEAHFTYMREGQLAFLKSQATGAVSSSCTGAAASFCFTGTSDSSAITSVYGTSPKLGITPGLPATQTGVPYINISGGAVLGNNFEEQLLPQVGNSFQWNDSLTWIKGNHTFKFGADVRRERFNQTLYFNVNGEYTFDNSGVNGIVPGDGDQYAEFLLGLADAYSQGSPQTEFIRSTSVYPFVQDSWKIRPNVTLNYGLRWELDTPLTDVSGHVETYRPGQNSTVHPCQLSPDGLAYWATIPGANPAGTDCNSVGVTPTGLVVPGDKGVPAGQTSTYYKAFAPRIGLAYSPGKDGKTSIRAGYGVFYNPIEQLVLEQFGAEPPFGGSSSVSGTFLNTPFVPQSGAVATPNPFNGFITPAPGQPFDPTLFRPILLFGEFQPHLRTQYSDQYNLTIQRELAKDLLLQVGYVGSQGHRLLASHDINPSTPQTCLDIAAIASQTGIGCSPTVEDSEFLIPASAVAPAGGFHIPYGPNGPTVIPAGSSIGSVAPNGLTLVGLRPFSSPNCNPFTGAGCPADGIPVFTDIFAEDTIANSNYNALEVLVEKRFSKGLQFQAAYTFSKSIDDGSTFEETLNPFNFRASRAASLFNSKQRLVISYVWQLPTPKYQGWKGKVLNDWSVSGITQFQSGFPIRLDTQDDNELINSLFFTGTEAPSLVAPFQKLNPKSNATGLGTAYWFNPNDFADPPVGQFNNGTQRTICCGPGLQEWDFSVHKQIPFSESRYVQFRAEFFNIFNHTNFFNPDGHFSDGPTSFGRISQAQDPRLLQFALKFYF